MNKKQKVIVAMSGGIDSSVAAALLKNKGFNPELGRRVDIIGVFMRFWSEPSAKKSWNRCCSPEAEKRARWIAAKLGVPFYIVDAKQEFKKRVVDYFLREYKRGATPNPCVVCNKEIKFGLLLEKALAMGADYVATGHYARIISTKSESFANKRIRGFVNSRKMRYSLMAAQDKTKDQSYFLWQLNQRQLSRILFPIGDYTKTEVRKLAKKFNLPVLDIPESQEICFVNSLNEFLTKHFKQKPGNIINTDGKIIGRHQGLLFFTTGQRKGIGLSGGPYWVLDKDLKKNTLIVTGNEKDLYKKELIATNINWIAGCEPLLCSPQPWRRRASPGSSSSGGQVKFPLKVRAKIRYRQKASPAALYKLSARRYKLIFRHPQRAITPGQSVVFYRGAELLGGATID